METPFYLASQLQTLSHFRQLSNLSLFRRQAIPVSGMAVETSALFSFYHLLPATYILPFLVLE